MIPRARLHPSARLLALLSCLAGLVLTAPTQVQAQSAALPAIPPELEPVRSALEKYRDPIVAVHDGYLSTLGCVTFPEPGGEGEVAYPAGGMGVHFVNVGLIGPTVDPLRPQILIYEPRGDELHLVAAEWFVPLATKVEGRPQLFGQAFDGPMEGHHPLLPQQLHHYDLHVWLWKENPEGLFSPTNPELRCPDGRYTFPERAAKLVPHP